MHMNTLTNFPATPVLGQAGHDSRAGTKETNSPHRGTALDKHMHACKSARVRDYQDTMPQSSACMDKKSKAQAQAYQKM